MPDKPAIRLYKDKTVGWASTSQPVFGRDKAFSGFSRELEGTCPFDEF